MRARKKPVEVKVIQWMGTFDSFTELVEFANVTKFSQMHNNPMMIHEVEEKNQIHIMTLEGEMRANVGDYIIQGVSGEFYPCKPDIFEKTYEIVEE